MVKEQIDKMEDELVDYITKVVSTIKSPERSEGQILKNISQRLVNIGRKRG